MKEIGAHLVEPSLHLGDDARGLGALVDAWR